MRLESIKRLKREVRIWVFIHIEKSNRNLEVIKPGTIIRNEENENIEPPDNLKSFDYVNSISQTKRTDMINHEGDGSSKHLSSREDIYMNISSRNNIPFKSKSVNKHALRNFSHDFTSKIEHNNNPYTDYK